MLGIGALLGPIIAALAKLFTFEGLKYLATRAMLLTLFTLVLPVVLYNVYSGIVSELLTWTSSQVTGSSLTGSVISLTGVGAWLADQLRLPQCLSLLLSALGLRFALSAIHR